MRQLLVTLTDSLNHFSDAHREYLVDKTLSKLFNLAFTERDALQAKPALQALELLISKHIVSLSILLTSFQQWTTLNVDQSFDTYDRIRIAKLLIFACLQWLPNADKASSAANLACTICKAFTATEQDSWTHNIEEKIPVWAPPIIALTRRSANATQALQNYVFPTLFKQSPSYMISFLELLQIRAHLGLDANSTPFQPNQKTDINIENETSLLYAALQTAKEIGTLREIDAAQPYDIETHESYIGIQDSCFGRFMSSASASKRLAGLSLLVSSASSTRPFTNRTLQCLRRSLPDFHVDPDLSFRGELLSLIQKLVDRLRAATLALKRNGTSRFSHPSNQQSAEKTPNESLNLETRILQAHQGFIYCYRRFLVDELRPTAPYQRRICSLKALLVLLRSGLDPLVPVEDLSRSAQGQVKWPFQIHLIDVNLVQLLLNLLLDPYDDIRLSSATILKFAIRSPAKRAPCLKFNKLRAFLTQAELLMLSSGRADHADGVAWSRALLFDHPNTTSNFRSAEPRDSALVLTTSKLGIVNGLVESIQKSISVAASNLARAVDTHPMHGALASLR